jgi:uncharacterized protein YndB with AHSA1/START domain
LKEKLMSPNNQSLSFDQKINCAPSLVYQAFTNATTLREFMCEVATVDPKPGGRFYMAWDSGFYTAGSYTQLEENKLVAFTWNGRDDPAASQVEIRLEEAESGTHVHLVHSGIGEGEAWDKSAAEFSKGWKLGLENLASLLQTGEDLRLVNRPMMGVLWGELTPETADELGVPVTEGVRLGGTVEGLGAHSAGLQKDDVLVEMAGRPLKGWNDLAPILADLRAGDRVEVVFYRHADKHVVPMTLGKRPLPDIPWETKALAEYVSQRNQQAVETMQAFFENVSEEEASFKPAPNEWSIKEVMAHIIQGERYGQYYLLELVGGQERWSDSYVGNENIMIQGTLAVNPTLSDLLEEAKRVYQVSTVMFASLPVDFPEKRKGSYWRLAYNWMQPDYHWQDHSAQMTANLELFRSQ